MGFLVVFYFFGGTLFWDECHPAVVFSKGFEGLGYSTTMFVGTCGDYSKNHGFEGRTMEQPTLFSLQDFGQFNKNSSTIVLMVLEA